MIVIILLTIKKTYFPKSNRQFTHLDKNQVMYGVILNN